MYHHHLWALHGFWVLSISIDKTTVVQWVTEWLTNFVSSQSSKCGCSTSDNGLRLLVESVQSFLSNFVDSWMNNTDFNSIFQPSAVNHAINCSRYRPFGRWEKKILTWKLLQAILQDDGNVLVVGGGGQTAQTASELWNNATGAWVTVAPLPAPKINFGIARIDADRSIAFGGSFNSSVTNTNGTSSAFIYTVPFSTADIREFVTVSPAASPSPSTSKSHPHISMFCIYSAKTFWKSIEKEDYHFSFDIYDFCSLLPTAVQSPLFEVVSSNLNRD